jgi:hypothetical protein
MLGIGGLTRTWTGGGFESGRNFDVEVLGLEALYNKLAEERIYIQDGTLWGREFADIVARKLQTATRTWDHKPTFNIQVLSEGSGSARVSVTTTSEIFGYVNEGTRAHFIAPKKPGGVLAFNSRFSPKSTPGSLQARRGSSGPPVAFARGVHHPGTKARKFDELASRQAQVEGSRIVLDRIMKIWG